jgi:hypothetical protein
MGALAFLVASPAFAQSKSGPHVLKNLYTSISVGFDTADTASTIDANRVESLIDATFNVNYAAIEPAGGASTCNDPDEFFGQAEGYPDATKPPLMVGAGTHASYVSATQGMVADATTFTRLLTCPAVHEDGLTRTIYTLSTDYSSSVKIQRTFRFHAGLGVVANTGLRAYIPRFISIFHYVLVPNKEGKVVKYDANSCTTAPCAITDWNGRWFAASAFDNQGAIVIREPSATPAFIAIQSGGLSNANFTSIVLEQPSTGWSGIVTETEYICFYNYLSWGQGYTLPSYCLPPKKSAATR